MKRTKSPNLPSTLARVFAIAVAMTAATAATASLSALQELIANPSDGGAGPGIWLSTSGTNNVGSDSPGPAPDGLAAYTLTEANTDFFGTAGQAFALRTEDGDGIPTTSGAGIAGSTATTYLTGTNATLVLTFKTPSTFATVSLVERGPDSAANSFELVLLNSGILRLSYRNTGSSDRVNLQTLVPNTWYYVAISWDLSNPTNNLKWHVGQMGSATLASGAVTATVVGDTTSAIRIAGRANTLLYFGPYQNIAMYGRTLSAGAIEDHFAAITAALKRLSDSISSPADGGAGPAIWYATSGTNNIGSVSPGTAPSGLATYTLDKPVNDYFGNPNLAFALRDGATSGAGISGSGATGYATGPEGSVVMTFLTQATLADASLFSRGPFASPPNLELFLFAETSSLRLTLDNQELHDFATLAPGTWYYLAFTWDTSLPSNQVSWYLGAMDNAPAGLASGTITAAAVGNPAQSIFIAGRPGTAASNYAGAFQNIAIYDRTLSALAVEDQFAAIAETAAEPGAISVLLSGGMIEVQFTGILQESGDLSGWEDLDPQPPSPWQFSLDAGDKRFFRARSSP